MTYQYPTEENNNTVNEIHYNSIDLLEGLHENIKSLAFDIKDFVNLGFKKNIYNHRNFGSDMSAYRLRDEALFQLFKPKFEALYSLVFPDDEKTQEQHETWFKICWHILAYSQMRHMQNWKPDCGLEAKSIAMKTALFNIEIVGNLMQHSCDYESMPIDYVIRCLTGMQ